MMYFKGHFSPHKWTTKVKLPEYKRVAVVWMEKYQELYWARLGKG